MTQPDDNRRGAVRFNLVDAVVVLVILGAIPLAYGSYVLFRAQPPTLASVSPLRLSEGHAQRIEIEGTNLRPFLRVSFNATPAKSFLIGSTTYALVDAPDLKAGTYDVVLYDHAQEVARLPKALTVDPREADVALEVTGAFTSAAGAAPMPHKVGDKFPPAGNPVAEVVAVSDPSKGDLRLRMGGDTIKVPLIAPVQAATLRVKCYTARRSDGTVQCLVPGGPGDDAGMVVAPDALLMLSSPSGPVAFQIASVQAPK